jgi:WD40 repeat protein
MTHTSQHRVILPLLWALLTCAANEASAAPSGPRTREAFARAIHRVKAVPPEDGESPPSRPPPAGMSLAQVRALLGDPDDVITPADDRYLQAGEQIWCYGTDGHGTLPTLGKVCFRSGQATWVQGGQGSPPRRGLFHEPELRRLLRLIDRVQDPATTGTEFWDPLRFIQAVNALQPLGGERVLAAIGEYCRVVASVAPGEWPGPLGWTDVDRGGLFALLAILFKVTPDPEQPWRYDIYPVTLLDDIPLALFGSGNSPRHLDAGTYLHFARHGRPRPAPLFPSSRPLDVLAMAPIIAWQPGDETWARSEVMNPLLRLIAPAFPLQPDRDGNLITRRGRVEERWRQIVADVDRLDLCWDPIRNTYVRRSERKWSPTVARAFLAARRLAPPPAFYPQGALSRYITGTATAPDGKTIAAGCVDGAVRLWDVRRGELHALLRGHIEQPCALAFAPDGRTLAASGYDEVQLWDVGAARLVSRLPGPHKPIMRLAFSPDGRALAGVWPGGPIYIWDVATARTRATMPYASPAGGGVITLAFSPDGRTLATGNDSGVSGLWDTTTGELRATLGEQGNPIWVLAFVPGKPMLATASWGGEVELWDTATGRPGPTLEGGRGVGIPYCATVSPNARLLVVGDSSRKLRIWEVASGKLRATLTGRWRGVVNLAFSPDSRLLAALCSGTTTRVWDMAMGRPVPRRAWPERAPFMAPFLRPVLWEDAVVSLHDPLDGRVLAKMAAVPGAGPPGGATAGEAGFTTTPEGYFDASPAAQRAVLWNIGGHLYPATCLAPRFRRPDLVRQALSGRHLRAPRITNREVPPSVRIMLGRDATQTRTNWWEVTVEATAARRLEKMECWIDGRSPRPGQVRRLRAYSRSVLPGSAAFEAGRRYVRVYRYQIARLTGVERVTLRVVVQDSAHLRSEAAEATLPPAER